MIGDIISKLVIKTLHKISGYMDYKYLNELIQALYANSNARHTNLADGIHGHIDLIIKYTMYTTFKTVTLWEYQKDPGSSPTISEKATFHRRWQANKTLSESRQFFENSTTMDKALKHQVIETIEVTYIVEIRNKYTRFVGFKTIDLVHHLIYRYG